MSQTDFYFFAFVLRLEGFLRLGLGLARNRFLVGCSVIFLLHQLWEPHFRIDLIDNYLDDILCMPIVLGITLELFRLHMGRDYEFPVYYIIVATAYIGIMAEWVFPIYSDYFVFDWIDLLAYALGAAMHYTAIKAEIFFSKME